MAHQATPLDKILTFILFREIWPLAPASCRMTCTRSASVEDVEEAMEVLVAVEAVVTVAADTASPFRKRERVERSRVKRREKSRNRGLSHVWWPWRPWWRRQRFIIRYIGKRPKGPHLFNLLLINIC